MTLVPLHPSSSTEEVAWAVKDMACSFSQPQLVRDVQWRLEVLPHCTPLPNLLQKP